MRTRLGRRRRQVSRVGRKAVWSRPE
jgi:hypothetical protein